MMCGPWCEYWLFILMILGAVESAHQGRKVQAAQKLRVGMTEKEVLEIMGPPDIDYRPRWNHWCYGMSIDVEAFMSEDGSANYTPILWRMFSYDANDVVIRWDNSGKAGVINRPQDLDVPAEFYPILDSFLFVRDIFDLITDRP